MANVKTTIFFKIIVIGDGGVGKTCAIQRYTQQHCDQFYVPTVGVDFAIKKVVVDGRNVKMQIWDTAGQEKFRSIVRLYYRGAHGIIVMYDLTKRSSFEHVENWLKDVRMYADDHVPIILVGNKCDLEDCHQVELEDCVVLMKKYPDILSKWEISAQKAIKINEPFDYLAEHLVKKSESKTEVLNDAALNKNVHKTCCF